MDDLRPGWGDAGCGHTSLAATLWRHWNLYWTVGLGSTCHSNNGQRPHTHHPLQVRSAYWRRACCLCMIIDACAPVAYRCDD